MKKITLAIAAIAAAFTMNAQSDCANAQVVSVADDASTTVSVSPLSGSLPSGSCFDIPATFNQPTNADWFVYTAGSEDVLVTVSSNIPANSNATTLNTILSVFQGSCGSLTCLTANDNASQNTPLSTAQFVAEAGTSYYIVFDDLWANNPGTDGWTNVGFDFEVTTETRDCNVDTTLPFFEDADAPLFDCYTVIDNDGNGAAWIQETADIIGDSTPETFFTNGSNTTSQKDDYLISPAITLESGKTYSFESTMRTFNTNGGTTANESVDIVISSGNTVADVNNGIVLFSQTGLTGTDPINVSTTFTVPSNGDYHVAYKSYAPSPAAFLLIMDYEVSDELGVNDYSETEFNHYIQNEILNIESNSSIENVTIFNILGQQVATQKVAAQDAQVNVGSFKPGVYLAQVQVEGKVKTFKFVKK